MDKKKLEFRYFFNAGLDKATGICDGEGTDIYERDDTGDLHYVGSLYGYLPEEISGMTESELDEVMEAAGIMFNL
jgi:hypothetical protein